MFSHVMLGTNDIDRAETFYNAVLGVLGAGTANRNVANTGHVRLFWRHHGNVFCVSQPINDRPASAANGATLGFACESAEQVNALHDVAIKHGATPIEDAPGLRNSSTGAVYLAYFRDPDGNKICAVFRPESA
ncbi:VOC family protein [Pantoea sp. 1.19]|uniref:VOC family protein n=1 Tax=Pantoea sp. 1.19 TaxID=1925589 RepID=UPI000948A43E|nr:VOC family protein [Pantoea sp. 1.19]